MKKLLLLIFMFSTFNAVASPTQPVEVTQQGLVLLFKINDLPRNAVSKSVLQALNQTLDRAEKTDNIGAVVITGSGEVFSAGAGGEVMQKADKNAISQSQLAYETFLRMEYFPKLIIAAVNGVSAGGGNELALACDMRFASKNAKFRQHELQAGLIPGFGATQRLPRLIGRSKAMEMMLNGEFITAEQAQQMGLITQVLSEDQLLPYTLKQAQHLSEILDKKALAAFKTRMADSQDESYTQALSRDKETFDALAHSPDAAKAIQKFIQRQQTAIQK